MTSNHTEAIIQVKQELVVQDAPIKSGFSKEIPVKGGPAIIRYKDSAGDNDEKANHGGRLKIFLEGKMVVEFSDRREGEKRHWIPVTKKTYWPPPTAPGSWSYDIPTPHSLASDDNSSVHSASWHRETRYKNSSPRHSKHSTRDFYLKVPCNSRTKSVVQKLIAGRYGRRPFDSITFREERRRGRSQKCTLSEIVQKLTQKFVKPAKLKESTLSPRKRALDRSRGSLLVQKRTKAQSNIFRPQTKEYDKRTSYSIDSILGRQEEKTVRARSASALEQLPGPSSVFSKRMPSPVVARRGLSVSSPVPSAVQMPFLPAAFDPALGYLLANQQELMRVISLQNTQAPASYQFPYSVPPGASFPGLPTHFWPPFSPQQEPVQRPPPVSSPWQGSPQPSRRQTPDHRDFRESPSRGREQGDDKPLNLTKSSN